VGTLSPKKLLRTRAGAVEYVLSGRGRPVWILLSGAGVALEAWRGLYPDIERLGTVLAWNRLGLGASSRPHAPQSGLHVLADLRELLEACALSPPYVLVAHSLGGLHANLFARLYPGDVAGMILLEATHPGGRESLRSNAGRLERVLGKLMDLPRAGFGRNLHAELDGVEETTRQVAAAGAFPDVPLIVVSAGRDPPRWLVPPQALQARRAHQRELVQLSPQGEQVIARRSGHFPQRSDPALVLDVMKRMAARLAKAARREPQGSTRETQALRP
jgi:pimeloyl-ACP methyl ester carboxylesterase